MKELKRLWAPWRLAYVRSISKKKDSCPFCELPAQKDDAKNLILYKDTELFVVMNKYPYNPNHIMVIPRAHVAKPGELKAGVWMKCAAALDVSLECLQKAVDPQGFNLGMNIGVHGGAGIAEHLHWHIVPRWRGDTNFMPLIAETKALPTHNETVYQNLSRHFVDFKSKLAKRLAQLKK